MRHRMRHSHGLAFWELRRVFPGMLSRRGVRAGMGSVVIPNGTIQEKGYSVAKSKYVEIGKELRFGRRPAGPRLGVRRWESQTPIRPGSLRRLLHLRTA